MRYLKAIVPLTLSATQLCIIGCGNSVTSISPIDSSGTERTSNAISDDEANARSTDTPALVDEAENSKLSTNSSMTLEVSNKARPSSSADADTLIVVPQSTDIGNPSVTTTPRQSNSADADTPIVEPQSSDTQDPSVTSTVSSQSTEDQQDQTQIQASPQEIPGDGLQVSDHFLNGQSTAERSDEDAQSQSSISEHPSSHQDAIVAEPEEITRHNSTPLRSNDSSLEAVVGETSETDRLVATEVVAVEPSPSTQIDETEVVDDVISTQAEENAVSSTSNISDDEIRLGHSLTSLLGQELRPEDIADERNQGLSSSQGTLLEGVSPAHSPSVESSVSSSGTVESHLSNYEHQNSQQDAMSSIPVVHGESFTQNNEEDALDGIHGLFGGEDDDDDDDVEEVFLNQDGNANSDQSAAEEIGGSIDQYIRESLGHLQEVVYQEVVEHGGSTPTQYLSSGSLEAIVGNQDVSSDQSVRIQSLVPTSPTGQIIDTMGQGNGVIHAADMESFSRRGSRLGFVYTLEGITNGSDNQLTGRFVQDMTADSLESVIESILRGAIGDQSAASTPGIRELSHLLSLPRASSNVGSNEMQLMSGTEDSLIIPEQLSIPTNSLEEFVTLVVEFVQRAIRDGIVNVDGARCIANYISLLANTNTREAQIVRDLIIVALSYRIDSIQFSHALCTSGLIEDMMIEGRRLPEILDCTLRPVEVFYPAIMYDGFGDSVAPVSVTPITTNDIMRRSNINPQEGISGVGRFTLENPISVTSGIQNNRLYPTRLMRLVCGTTIRPRCQERLDDLISTFPRATDDTGSIFSVLNRGQVIDDENSPNPSIEVPNTGFVPMDLLELMSEIKSARSPELSSKQSMDTLSLGQEDFELNISADHKSRSAGLIQLIEEVEPSETNNDDDLGLHALFEGVDNGLVSKMIAGVDDDLNNDGVIEVDEIETITTQTNGEKIIPIESVISNILTEAFRIDRESAEIFTHFVASSTASSSIVAEQRGKLMMLDTDHEERQMVIQKDSLTGVLILCASALNHSLENRFIQYNEVFAVAKVVEKIMTFELGQRMMRNFLPVIFENGIDSNEVATALCSSGLIEGITCIGNQMTLDDGTMVLVSRRGQIPEIPVGIGRLGSISSPIRAIEDTINNSGNGNSLRQLSNNSVSGGDAAVEPWSMEGILNRAARESSTFFYSIAERLSEIRPDPQVLSGETKVVFEVLRAMTRRTINTT